MHNLVITDRNEVVCDSEMGEYCTPDLYLTSSRLDSMPIAMAYVPWQRWRLIYDTSAGFQKGTIFGELDLPYKDWGGVL